MTRVLRRRALALALPLIYLFSTCCAFEANASVAKMIAGDDDLRVSKCALDTLALKNLTYKSKAISLAMIDASSLELGSIGNYETCSSVCETVNCSKWGGSSYEPSTHCVLTTGFDWQGICVPSSCSEEDVPEFLLVLLGFKIGNATKVHCGSHDYGAISPWAWFVVSVIILLGATVAYATVKDIYQKKSPHSQLEEKLVDEKGTGNLDVVERPRPASLLQSFSLPRSYGELFGWNPKRKHVLDGVRALSLAWVILGHTINFILDMGMSNPFDFFPLKSNDAFACSPEFSVFIVGANFAVDTFFFLSAFLATLVMVRKLERGGKIPILKAILFRFIRLVPVLAFVIVVFSLFVPYLGTGPFWFLVTDMTKHCGDYWWTNIAFINNMHPAEYTLQCVPWTWYLANDFQFFVLALCLIVLLRKQRLRMQLFVLAALIVASASGTAYIAWTRQAKYVDLLHPDHMQNLIYDKPWCRAPAYLIGMFAAYVYAKTDLRIGHIKGWLTCAVCILAPPLIGYTDICPDFKLQGKWGNVSNTLYLSLSRPMWTLGVGIMVFMCMRGDGGVIGKVLAWRPFDSLAKLTFAAYLVHPIIIRLSLYTRNDLIDFSFSFFFFHFIAFYFISFIVAAIIFMFVEHPFSELLGKLSGKTKRK